MLLLNNSCCNSNCRLIVVGGGGVEIIIRVFKYDVDFITVFFVRERERLFLIL